MAAENPIRYQGYRYDDETGFLLLNRLVLLARSRRKSPSTVKRKDVIEDYQRGTSLQCPLCNKRKGNKD